MPLQDLTPQLRTRLSRMERAVGLFVTVATVLLILGFCYYVYNTAKQKGWFKVKAKFFTYVNSAAGLKVGDEVTLMGFQAGRITRIVPEKPRSEFNVYVEFELIEPNYGYIWTKGSVASIQSAGLLNSRAIEVTKGSGGYAIYLHYPVKEILLSEAGDYADSNRWRLAQDIYRPGTTQLLAHAFQPLTNLQAIASIGCTQIWILDHSDTEKKKGLAAEWNEHTDHYDPYTKDSQPYWLRSRESPAVGEQVQELVGRVQAALPGILDLTNQITKVLINAANLTSNLNYVTETARPAVSNLALVTKNLPDLKQPGALGEWLLPTNINVKLDTLLSGADVTLTNVNKELDDLVAKIGGPLDNLADLTSNLNHQVEVNSNMLSSISKAIIDADTFVQGLKRHWLLRSAFKNEKTNSTATVYKPLPKDGK